MLRNALAKLGASEKQQEQQRGGDTNCKYVGVTQSRARAQLARSGRQQQVPERLRVATANSLAWQARCYQRGRERRIQRHCETSANLLQLYLLTLGVNNISWCTNTLETGRVTLKILVISCLKKKKKGKELKCHF